MFHFFLVMVMYGRRIAFRSRGRAYGRSVRRRRAIGVAARRVTPRRARAIRPVRVFTSPTTTAATNIFRLLQGPASAFPKSIKARLRYCDQIGFTHPVGVLDSEIYRMNSLFDPFYGTGGHQPRYFDQLCGTGLYLHYVVVGCKYTITVPECFNPCNVLVQATLTPTVLATTNQTMAETSELPFSQLTYAGNGVNIISGYVDCAKLFGINRAELISNWEKYGGTQGANPTDECFLHIYAAPLDNLVGSVATTYMMVNLEYDAIFDRRDNVPLSN